MKVTLTDVAERLGVSASTVQRALAGLGGVGEARRGLIKRVAEEMGYRRNLTASSLKTGARTIGIVLPEPGRVNRFYAKFLWEGALRCCAEYKEFNVDVAEFTYVRTPEGHAAALREALGRRGAGLDGVLTMGTPAAGASEIFAEFRARGIPVVFVGTDSGAASSKDRVCCVRTYDEMAGRMAADLLVNFTAPRKGGKVVMTGDFAIPDQFYNAQGFERHLYESGMPLAVHKLSGDLDLQAVRKAVAGILAADLSGSSGSFVHAVYATSSRNTVPVCEAVEEAAAAVPGGRKVFVLGSDIFPESVDFLRRGVLNATIHKRPADQAYHAMRALVDIVVKGKGAGGPVSEGSILIDPVIVMKSNLECFL